jgi:hypothetical protein
MCILLTLKIITDISIIIYAMQCLIWFIFHFVLLLYLVHSRFVSFYSSIFATFKHV